MQTLCPESGLRTPPNWPKIQKKAMTSKFSDMTSSSIFFSVVFFLWSSLVTDSRFMSISSLLLELWQFSFIRDWPEIWILVLPSIWRLGRVMDNKFDKNVSNRMLLNPAKFQGYNFYCFWIIKGKPTSGVEVPLLTQIRVGNIHHYIIYSGNFNEHFYHHKS